MANNEKALAAVSQMLNEVLALSYGQPMHFVLLTTSAETNVCSSDYVTNASKMDCIKWLRDIADQLEQNQEIPRTQKKA